MMDHLKEFQDKLFTIVLLNPRELQPQIKYLKNGLWAGKIESIEESTFLSLSQRKQISLKKSS